MFNITIIFRDQNHTKQIYNNVAYQEAHTYGFLELRYTNGSNEQFNLSDIFSYKIEPVEPVA
jgi:hypothetical protein